MKKEYSTPELDVLSLEQEDIITASSPGDKKPTAGVQFKGQWDTWT